MHDSPFRRLRILAGFGHGKFALRADISTTALSNIEAGMYDTVPIRANATLAQACQDAGVNAVGVLENEYAVKRLNDAMDIWKTQKREQTDLSAAPLYETTKQLVEHEFGTYAKFCRAMCVPTATWEYYASGKAYTMPLVILRALNEAGYQWTNWLK